MATEPQKNGNGGGETAQEAVTANVSLIPAGPAQLERAQAAPVQFDPDDPVALYMNTTVFTQLQRVARLMSSAHVVPEHLQGDSRLGDCFLVVAQAFRWRMDPFAVAQCSFVYKGHLGYEGKLIAAVVNSNPRIEERLDYEYSGSGTDRRVVVTARLRGEKKARSITGSVGDWKTDNEKWRTMPDQMLAYRGAREWARRHMPEAVLGVAADEELDARDSKPPLVVISPDSLSPDAFKKASVTGQDNAPEHPRTKEAAAAQRAAEEQPLEMVEPEPEKLPPARSKKAQPCEHRPIRFFAKSKEHRNKTMVCVDCKVEVLINKDGILSLVE